MTWRVSKLSGTSAPPPAATWRVSSISGALGSTWRISKITGSSIAPSATWRVSKLTGAILAGWRVSSISGAVAVSAAPAAQLTNPGTIDPITAISLQATISNGVAADSWVWTTSAGSILWTNSMALLSPPGSAAGNSITVTATASLAGNAGPTASIVITVRPAYAFWVDKTGTLRALSPLYQQK